MLSSRARAWSASASEGSDWATNFSNSASCNQYKTHNRVMMIISAYTSEVQMGCQHAACTRQAQERSKHAVPLEVSLWSPSSHVLLPVHMTPPAAPKLLYAPSPAVRPAQRCQLAVWVHHPAQHWDQPVDSSSSSSRRSAAAAAAAAEGQHCNTADGCCTQPSTLVPESCNVH
jgi:hypothetical protein